MLVRVVVVERASNVPAMEPASSESVSVDRGVDDRHEDIVAFRESMRLRQAQFGKPVLGGVAFGPGFYLLQHEQVIRLRPGHEPIRLELAHDRCDRAVAFNAPTIKRRARQLERLAFKARQPVPALQRFDLLCAD